MQLENWLIFKLIIFNDMPIHQTNFQLFSFYAFNFSNTHDVEPPSLIPSSTFLLYIKPREYCNTRFPLSLILSLLLSVYSTLKHRRPMLIGLPFFFNHHGTEERRALASTDTCVLLGENETRH